MVLHNINFSYSSPEHHAENEILKKYTPTNFILFPQSEMKCDFIIM